MIDVRVGELVSAEAGALVRPVATDFSPVTPAMRRFDEAAGASAREQWERMGELPVGSAVITAAGDLSADYVVHVAVRSPTENPSGVVVRQGLLNALRRLADWGIETVAVAPLGTGAGNLDAQESAAVMVPVIAEHQAETGRPERVEIVVEDDYQETVFRAAVEHHRAGGPAPGGPGPGEGAGRRS